MWKSVPNNLLANKQNKIKPRLLKIDSGRHNILMQIAMNVTAPSNSVLANTSYFIHMHTS